MQRERRDSSALRLTGFQPGMAHAFVVDLYQPFIQDQKKSNGFDNVAARALSSPGEYKACNLCLAQVRPQEFPSVCYYNF